MRVFAGWCFHHGLNRPWPTSPRALPGCELQDGCCGTVPADTPTEADGTLPRQRMRTCVLCGKPARTWCGHVHVAAEGQEP